MDSKCKGTTTTGEPCGATLYRDDYCYWHHPALEAERQANRAAGGRARSNAARAKKRLQRLELDEIDAALCTAMLDVLRGDLEPGLATAAASVARTIHAVRTATEHERRISELEQALNTTPKGWTA